ncbi:hypothetical protein MXEN_02039 [Mycobacterium xenopi RIVM700367]|nr:hypothetical protein MXEN_02039 [Mycobacterium xenopi RIVM700367]
MAVMGVVPVSLALLLSACGPLASPTVTSRVREMRASHPVARVVAGPVAPDPRVGAFFLAGGDLHTCTGSVLDSVGGDLVLTAAHCLGGGTQPTFVPGFGGRTAPDDTWTVDAVYLDPRWIAGRDPHADYAIARVSRRGGGSVQARAGAGLTLGLAPARNSRVRVIAYQAGVGGTPIGCQASTGITSPGYPSLRCAGLVDGTSGAPWISGSTVVGLIGGLDGGGCGEELSYSAPFDEHIAWLLQRAEAGGPGDAAPADFDDGC